MLDIDEELSASAGKASKADSTLAEIRAKIIEEEEEASDALEIEDEPPVSPTTVEVEKSSPSHIILILFCKKGAKIRQAVEKSDAYAQREIMKQNKPKIIGLL